MTNSPTLSSDNDILTYSFTEQTGPAAINSTSHTVDIEVSNTASLSSLVATFTVSFGASATVSGTTQVSGTTTNNFTNPVTYVIAAEDGSTQNWVVAASLEESSDLPPVISAEVLPDQFIADNETTQASVHVVDDSPR